MIVRAALCVLRTATLPVRHALFWLLVATLLAPAGSAQSPAEEQPVESGRSALRRGFPWYDAQADRVQRIEVKPPQDLENRHSRWVFNSGNWNWSFPPWLGELLTVLMWLGFALLLLFLVYLLVRAFVWYEGGSVADSDSSPSTVHADADRVESLPFQVQRPLSDFLDEARRCYEAGRYGEAIIYLYSYQLVELDKHQVIRLSRGKTNRQYLREARRRPVLSELLQRTMIAFEDVFFGDYPLERARFESCWNALDQFHQHLEQAVA